MRVQTCLRNLTPASPETKYQNCRWEGPPGQDTREASVKRETNDKLKK